MRAAALRLRLSKRPTGAWTTRLRISRSARWIVRLRLQPTCWMSEWASRVRAFSPAQGSSAIAKAVGTVPEYGGSWTSECVPVRKPAPCDAQDRDQRAPGAAVRDRAAGQGRADRRAGAVPEVEPGGGVVLGRWGRRAVRAGGARPRWAPGGNRARGRVSRRAAGRAPRDLLPIAGGGRGGGPAGLWGVDVGGAHGCVRTDARPHRG